MENKDLDEFLKFRESITFLATPIDRGMVYFHPKALLLHWLKEVNKSVRVVLRYREQFIVLTRKQLDEFALWVSKKREEADPFSHK